MAWPASHARGVLQSRTVEARVSGASATGALLPTKALAGGNADAALAAPRNIRLPSRGATMSISTKSFFAWLWLLAFTAIGVVGAQGLVLCIGPQGHLAVEAKSAGDCGGCLPAAHDSAASESTSSVDTAPSCPCDDITLPASNVVAAKSGTSKCVDWKSNATPLVFAHFTSCAAPGFGLCAVERSAAAKRAPPSQLRRFVLRV